MPYTYQQSTGILFDEMQLPVARGYAGRGYGKNNPTFQDVKGIGPLPVGTYTPQAPIDDDVVGKYAIRLIPSPSNKMFGRISFFMHGDSIAHLGQASHGCIVMPHDVRVAYWKSGQPIQVIA